MNQTEKAYIQLISACINKKEKVKIDFSKIDVEYLVRLCKIHRNVGLISLALNKAEDVPTDVKVLFEQGFYTEMMVYSKRMTIYYQVIEALKNNQIKHLVMKGMSIARLYPQEEVRTMNDIDLLVEKENFSKVADILKGMGARHDFEASNQNVNVFHLKKTCIEIHSSLAYAENFMQRYDYQEYFKNIFESAVLKDAFSYEMSPFYNMMYAIYHIGKHFYTGGCGVRMITDIAVMMNSYRDILDWKTFWQDLEEMGLNLFTKNLFILCDSWFDTNIIPENSNEKNISAVEDYIISGGVFGGMHMHPDSVAIEKRKKNHYLAAVMRWAFPSYESMRQHSAWFADKPAILLPAAYVERFLRNAKERGGIYKWIVSLKKNRKQNKEHDEILAIMELKQGDR